MRDRIGIGGKSRRSVRIRVMIIVTIRVRVRVQLEPRLGFVLGLTQTLIGPICGEASGSIRNIACSRGLQWT